MKEARVLQTKPYEVNPMTIRKELFFTPRNTYIEEVTRECILDALEMVKQKPQQYAKSFRTMRVLRLDDMKANELLAYCEKHLGCTYADWIETALEKAQRITNGEDWKEVCEHPETQGWDNMKLY